MTVEDLRGGVTNVGEVTREGDHVLRPTTPHTESIFAFLRALRRRGFMGAPLPVGVDDDGRERLEFIPGDAPVVPYPAWARSDAALASVVGLLRRFHVAARTFDPAGHAWAAALADPVGGTVMCHNDVELSNVVFRDGRAVALIDFEFAAPGRPEYDLAQLARVCVPVDDEFDQDRLGWRPADRPARLRLVADEYGLDPVGRATLLTAMDDALDRIETFARNSIADGDAAAVGAVERTGGIEKYDRRRAWWTTHRDQFAAALS